MSQPMFEIEFPEPKKRRRREGEHKAKDPTLTNKVEWKRVRLVKRPVCAECVRQREAGEVDWHAPDPVVWDRFHRGQHLYLCWAHGAVLREKEGLEPKPKSMREKPPQ